jgi:hypothetical protein
MQSQIFGVKSNAARAGGWLPGLDRAGGCPITSGASEPLVT